MRGAKVAKTQTARRLRRDSTDAERKLWYRLRSRSIVGFKFVRQEPIGRYVVDFICRERRLIVEVDGGQHADSQSDLDRDCWLAEHRYRVLRFWNNDVMMNIDGVLETIAAALNAEEAFDRSAPTPRRVVRKAGPFTPSPRRAGRGSG
jgi:very-short-patch-repair endonuclease